MPISPIHSFFCYMISFWWGDLRSLEKDHSLRFGRLENRVWKLRSSGMFELHMWAYIQSSYTWGLLIHT